MATESNPGQINAMDFELEGARVKFVAADDNDSGLDTYRVIAYDTRFGDELIIAEFGYDDTHEDGFYKRRAEFMANMTANIINR